MDFFKNIKLAQFATRTPSKPIMPQNNFQQAPQSPPPPSSMTPQTNLNSYPQRESKGILKIVGIIVTIIIVIVVALGAVLATRVWDPLWSPFRPAPEKVMETMMEKMLEVKSSHSKTTFEMSVMETKSKQGLKVSALLEGDGDVSDAKNPKGSLDFKLTATPSGMKSTDNSGNMSVRGQVVATGKNSTVYFKVDDLSLAILGEDATAIFDEIKGKWMKIDKDIVNKLNATGGDASTAQTISEEAIKNIQQSFLKSGIFVVSKQLNDETMQGRAVYHYFARVDKDRLVTMITDLMKTQLESELKKENGGEVGGEAMLTMAQGMVKGMIDEFSKKIGDLEADLYIGKSDNMLYGVNFEKAIDLSAIDKTLPIQMSIKFNIENSEFGKIVSVTEPNDSIPLDEILAPFIKEQEEKAKVAQAKADISQLRTVAELIYNDNKDSYVSLCTKGVLNGNQKTSGKQLVSLNDDIVSLGWTKPVCYANAKKYCVASQFGDSDSQCIDAKGSRGQGKCSPTTIECLLTNVTIKDILPSKTPPMIQQPAK